MCVGSTFSVKDGYLKLEQDMYVCGLVPNGLATSVLWELPLWA